MEAPEFWYPDEGERLEKLPPLLKLASAFYDYGGRLRQWAARPEEVPAAVFCVGNLVAGGVGKTPVALALAERLKARGRKVAFLTRGYGGTRRGPLVVDRAHHDAAAVGDEPLLLAASAPTVVARHRVAGAHLACTKGVDTIVMDDGFQNPSLAKDLSLVVVDSDTGFGNGRIIPAGPLREPVERGLARAQGLVLMGEAPVPQMLDSKNVPPILRARIEPEPPSAESIKGATLVAFAGIGRPAKFFSMLSALGCTILRAEGFPDHHPYSADELQRLKLFARASRARLVTTAKDLARIPATLRAGIEPISVRAVFANEPALERLIDQGLLAFTRRAKPAATAGARDPGALKTN
jgi:tetraacyldisaccharide 4'-kinase